MKVPWQLGRKDAAVAAVLADSTPVTNQGTASLDAVDISCELPPANPPKWRLRRRQFSTNFLDLRLTSPRSSIVLPTLDGKSGGWSLQGGAPVYDSNNYGLW